VITLSTPPLSPAAPHSPAGENGQPSPRAPRPEHTSLGDTLFRLLCKGAAGLVVLLAASLVAVLVAKSWYAMRTIGPGFLLGTVWDPVEGEGHHVFGALPFIYGTVTTSILAMLIAVPLGVGTAAFLAEIATPWLRRTCSFLVEMLAAIPSVVYGFWGMAVLKPFLDQLIDGSGNSIFSASLVLAIMIVPYVTAVSFDVCQAVPRSQREGALAVGASRWQTIWLVVLPYARPGIIGGSFLALGRALGETMAVTMLIGNATAINWPFKPGNTIASQIANQYAESKTNALYESVLIQLALVLLLVTVVVNSLARFLLWRMGKPRKLHTRWARLSGWTRNPVLSSREPVIPGSRLDTGRRSRWVNRMMTGVLALCLAITLGPLFLILSFLLFQGIGSLNWEFLTTALPIDGGIFSSIVGSLQLVGLAAFFAVPVGLLASIYLAEYRGGTFSKAVRFVGELMMGVPSIVVGIFAASVAAIIVKLAKDQLGMELRMFGLAGSFALGVMMIPIVLRASEEALKLVPTSLRHASYALGAPQWQTVLRVTLPAALTAIVTAVFLAIARIGGETAPLLLTASFNSYWPAPFPADYTPSLPMAVYEWSKYPPMEQQAWAAAFILMVLVLTLNFGIRLLTGKRIVLASRAD
jgi:phosphate transport system permease protein